MCRRDALRLWSVWNGLRRRGAVRLQAVGRGALARFRLAGARALQRAFGSVNGIPMSAVACFRPVIGAFFHTVAYVLVEAGEPGGVRESDFRARWGLPPLPKVKKAGSARQQRKKKAARARAMEKLGSIEVVDGVLYGVGGTCGLRGWETAQLGGAMALIGWAVYARGVGDGGDGDGDGDDGDDGDGGDGDGDDDDAVFGFGSQQPSDSAAASACGGSAAAGVRA
jgi:hypothetical protein